MIYLIASIISSTSIFILFKTTEKYSVRLLPLITINYFVAAIPGLLILSYEKQPVAFSTGWLLPAVILGIFFILLFCLIGLSTQKSGVTLTTLASKMSLIFPVLFSIYWFDEAVTIYKYAGITLAIAAVLLSVYKKDINRINRLPVLLPLVIFVGGGFSDSLVKYVQTVVISDTQSAAFTLFVFVTAFLLGIILMAAKGRTGKQNFNAATLLFGTILGLVNFGSLYFLIQALEESKLDSSLVYTLNNMLIVVLSAVAGRTFFKERLNRINVVGFALALISLVILI